MNQSQFYKVWNVLGQSLIFLTNNCLVDSNRLLVNLISRVHFHILFENEGFADHLVTCLIDIESCSPHLGSEFTLLTAYNVLQALIGSIATGAKARFPLNPVLYSAPHFNLKHLSLITMHLIFSSLNYGSIVYSAVPEYKATEKQDLWLNYLQNRKEYGLHAEYRKFARRMLRTLADIIKALQFNSTLSGAPLSQLSPNELAQKVPFEREMNQLSTELSDCEAFLGLLQAAEEQINRTMVDPASEDATIRLGEAFVTENVRKFYTAYGEKKTGFLAFVFPDLIKDEITRMCQ
jgi:hypothetical protein